MELAGFNSEKQGLGSVSCQLMYWYQYKIS